LVADKQEIWIFGSDSIEEERESFPTVYVIAGGKTHKTIKKETKTSNRHVYVYTNMVLPELKLKMLF